MLLNSNAWDDPRLVELTAREFALFIHAFTYSSRWNRATLTPRLLRHVGVTAKVAARFAHVGLALLEDDGSLTWACDEIARFGGGDRRESAARGAGYTYLIQAGKNGDVKIGSTHGSPTERLRALQTGSSEPLRLVKVLEGAHLEVELHALYAPFRTRGEWFQRQILDDFA